MDYYKLLPDGKRSLYTKLRSARAAVSYDNNNRDTRFSIARGKDLYGIVMQEGDITVESSLSYKSVFVNILKFFVYL